MILRDSQAQLMVLPLHMVLIKILVWMQSAESFIWNCMSKVTSCTCQSPQQGWMKWLGAVWVSHHLLNNACPFFFFLIFWGAHPQHMGVWRWGVKSELQLLAYTTATATRDPSRICDLHLSSPQCRILNPMSKARDRICVLMDVRFVSAEPWRELPHVVSSILAPLPAHPSQLAKLQYCLNIKFYLFHAYPEQLNHGWEEKHALTQTCLASNLWQQISRGQAGNPTFLGHYFSCISLCSKLPVFISHPLLLLLILFPNLLG